MQTLTKYSVPALGSRLCAIVPMAPFDALRRLKQDDPIWKGPEVYQHWVQYVDPNAHLRVSDRIVFYMESLALAQDGVAPVVDESGWEAA